MSKRNDVLKIISTTTVSIISSLTITYLLFKLLGENDVIRIKDGLLIGFIAPLIIASAVSGVFVRMSDRLREISSDRETLQGLLPICAQCKKIRDDQGYWNQIEDYIKHRTDAVFTHSVCPKCEKKLYGTDGST